MREVDCSNTALEVDYRVKSVEKATGRIVYEDFAVREDAIRHGKMLKAYHGDELAVFLVQAKAASFDAMPSGKSSVMSYRVNLVHAKAGQHCRKLFKKRKAATAYADKMAALGWTAKVGSIKKRGILKKPGFSRSIYTTRVKGVVSVGLPGLGKHR